MYVLRVSALSTGVAATLVCPSGGGTTLFTTLTLTSPPSLNNFLSLSLCVAHLSGKLVVLPNSNIYISLENYTLCVC